MKKMIGITLTLCLTLYLLTGCTKDSVVNYKLGVDLSGGNIIKNTDTHGGFHGDGITFEQIEFKGKRAEEVETAIQDSEMWRSLPLSDTLEIAVYGNRYYQSLVNAYDEVIPRITEGYYYFHDRHSESTDSEDESDLFHRGSFNFDIAIYDLVEHILYFYRLDT